MYLQLQFSDVVVTIIEKVQNRKQTISDKHLMKKKNQLVMK